MSSKVAGTWKVRPMPARACAWAETCVSSAPAKETRPVVGVRSPAKQLKNVDLPAPLGPIRPTISPSSTRRSAPATAWKSPNALEIFVASSSMRALLPLQAPLQFWRDRVPKFMQSARLEASEQDDDAAIQNVGEPGAAAAEPIVGRGMQRNEHQGSDKGTVQRAGTAERCDDDHLYGNEQAEAALRIDKTGFDRIQRAGKRRENRAQHQRIQFRALHRHAEAARGPFPGLYRAQVISEPAALHLLGDQQQQRKHGEKEIVVGKFAAERQVPPSAPDRRTLQADGRADQRPGPHQDADQLGNRDGGHAEVVALQAKRRRPHADSQNQADDNAERNAGDRWRTPQIEHQERSISAHAEKHPVPDGNLSGIATDNVPSGCGKRDKQKREADVQIKRIRQQQRVSEERSRQNQGCPFHARGL